MTRDGSYRGGRWAGHDAPRLARRPFGSARQVAAIASSLAAALVPSPGALGQCNPQKLTSSLVFSGDRYGYSVSVHGSFAVVGSRFANTTFPDTGAAFVLRNDGAVWVNSQTLVASDAASFDDFGVAVAMDGDVLVVGAFQDDDNGSSSGSAYVFRRSGLAYVQEQKLLPADGAMDDFFGVSVAVSGNVIVVGARGDDDNGLNAGSAYVFRHNGVSWVQEQKLLAADGGASDEYGVSVSVRGNVAVVGAQLDDDFGVDAGAAYIYRFDGAMWAPEQKLVGMESTAGDRFGFSVSCDGGTILVGSYLDDEMAVDAGSAYIFRFNGVSWAQEQKLMAADGALSDWFGWSVSISGDKALVGAMQDDSTDTDAGAAYLFEFDGMGWNLLAEQLAPDGQAGDAYGFSVALRNNVTLVGVPRDDDEGTEAGSVWIQLDDPSDCNMNGVPDACDIVVGTEPDCNSNGIPDPCELAPGGSGMDCNMNGIPDDCDPDADGDGAPDACDNCPNDPGKTEPGVCGCGVSDDDTDGDGTLDCFDGCPLDPDKIIPGVCGCAVPDVDTDMDGIFDCLDGCPLDPNKIDPGICGCGVEDLDTDMDGVFDCLDGCPLDPGKTSPEVCGCGIADTDTDLDGVPDCKDVCPGSPDIDTDGDGVFDCDDGCPDDPDKIAPGSCGCGISEIDTDGDQFPDCIDMCPLDPDKVLPGSCGCGVIDLDSDSDGTPDCIDMCPLDPDKIAPGLCGCSISDVDTDMDGTADCLDGCPLDPMKVSPGICGCGAPDADTDMDGIADCNDNCPMTPNPTQDDCDMNGVGDACEPSFADCNNNGVPDACDPDMNGTGVPDECEAMGDSNGDGMVNVTDLLAILSAWGPCAAPCGPDTNGDGQVNVTDLLTVLGNWG